MTDDGTMGFKSAGDRRVVTDLEVVAKSKLALERAEAD